ncbi:MAG: response regulator [Rhodobacteraceae bacterium]|nr:response regulator [Paracoccaceae bacterium]
MMTNGDDKHLVPVTMLVVEDDAPQRNSLAGLLLANRELEDHRIEQVEMAANLEQALGSVERVLPDLVILDDFMPARVGEGSEYLAEESCRKLRRLDAGMPIIILTGKYKLAPKGEENLVKLGLANHYEKKPIANHQTFLNRINYELRVRETSHYARYKFGPWVYYADSKQYDYNLRSRSNVMKQTLDPMKSKIIGCLYRQRGLPISAGDLVMEIWGDDSRDNAHKLNVHLSEIRKKLRLVEEDYQEPIIRDECGIRLNFNSGKPQVP